VPRPPEALATRIGGTMAASRPVPSLTSTDTAKGELEALQAEVEHLRTLVGPSEESYTKLRLDLLGARDAAIAAEAEVGRLRSRETELMVLMSGYERDFDWFREQIVKRMLRLRQIRASRRIISRLARR
jgi:hypothetical protein